MGGRQQPVRISVQFPSSIWGNTGEQVSFSDRFVQIKISSGFTERIR